MPTDDLRLTCPPDRLPTYFAAAERASEDELAHDVAAVVAHPVTRAVIDSAEVVLMILNEHRQIVAVNEEVLRRSGAGRMDELLGERAGEAFACVQLQGAPSGCGTSPSCATCGITNAILASSSDDHAVERDCLLSTSRDGRIGASEFRVRATPLHLDGRRLTVLSLRDVSGDRRREALERVFFHDILNTIAGLYGWSVVLRDSVDGEARALAERVTSLGDRLRREVVEQRLLVEAEKGTLAIDCTAVTDAELLEAAAGTFARDQIARERRIDVERAARPVRFETDRTLLLRILANMLKNALEATPEGGRVRLWSETDESTVRFGVWNEAVMPETVARQVFVRSFSTKGERGHGLGTYSMKLFGEQYLGGRVSFTSRPGEGTTFTISLPLGPRAC